MGAFLYNRLGKGWVTNALTDTPMPRKRDWAVRGTLAWQATDTIDVTMRYEHGDLQTRGAPFELFRIGPSLAAVQTRFKFSGLNGNLDGVTSISNSLNPLAVIGVSDQPTMAVDVAQQAQFGSKIWDQPSPTFPYPPTPVQIPSAFAGSIPMANREASSRSVSTSTAFTAVEGFNHASLSSTSIVSKCFVGHRARCLAKTPSPVLSVSRRQSLPTN